MGFRTFPQAKFVEIDIKDEVQLQRVTSRLIEMGIITPEQGMTALKQGVYPDPKDLKVAQEQFVEDREKGYYTPLTVAQPILPDDAPAPAQKPKVPGETGRPAGTNTNTDKIFAQDTHSRKDIQSVIYKIEDLRKYSESSLKKQYNKKRLSKQQKEMLDDLTQSVVMSKQIENWESTIEACIKDFNNIESLDVMNNVLEVGEKHELVSYPAAILYHSKKINK
jgi:hypothetical protein